MSSPQEKMRVVLYGFGFDEFMTGQILAGMEAEGVIPKETTKEVYVEPRAITADGHWIPQKCIDALLKLRERWPESTFSGAEGVVVWEVLNSVGYFDKKGER